MTALRGEINLTEDRFAAAIPTADRQGTDESEWYWDAAMWAARAYADDNAYRRNPIRDASGADTGKRTVEASPLIRMPGGLRYKFRDPLPVHYHDGGGIVGDSQGSPVVQFEGSHFLEYFRTPRFHVGKMRLIGPFTHGSHFVMFRQQKEDVDTAGFSTLQNTFEDITLERMHMGAYWYGNQMTDGVQFRHMRCKNVFRPLAFWNSQGVVVNWKHGEVIFGTEEPGYYADFFASFPNANAGNAGIYDAAAVYAIRGGQASLEDVSLITSGTHFLFANPAADDATLDPVKQNVLSFSMRNCRGEMRWPQFAKHGAVRSLVPHPSGPPAIVPKVYIDPATQFNCQYGGPVNLIHLSNGLEVINHARTHNKANGRILEYVNPDTGAYPGIYDSELGSYLNIATNTQGAPGPEDKHRYNRGSMGWR